MKSLGSIREEKSRRKSQAGAGENLSGYSPANLVPTTFEGATPRIRRRSEVGRVTSSADNERTEPSRRYSSFSNSATGNPTIEITASSPLQTRDFDDSPLTAVHDMPKKKKKVKIASLVSNSSAYDTIISSSTSSSSGTITPISTPATSPDLSVRIPKEDKCRDVIIEDEEFAESEEKFLPNLRTGFRLASVEEEEGEADGDGNLDSKATATVDPAASVQPIEGEELMDIRPTSVYFDAIEALADQLKLNRESQDLSEKIHQLEAEDEIGLQTGESDGESYFDMRASDSLGSLASLMTVSPFQRSANYC